MDQLLQLADDVDNIDEFNRLLRQMWEGSQPPRRLVMLVRLIRHCTSGNLRVRARVNALNSIIHLGETRGTMDTLVFIVAVLLLSVIDMALPESKTRYTLITDAIYVHPLIRGYRPMTEDERERLVGAFSFIGAPLYRLAHAVNRVDVLDRFMLSALLQSQDDFRSQLHADLATIVAAGERPFTDGDSRRRAIGDEGFLGTPVHEIQYAPVLLELARMWDIQLKETAIWITHFEAESVKNLPYQRALREFEAARLLDISPDFTADDALAQVWATDPGEARRMVQLRSRAMQQAVVVDPIRRRRQADDEDDDEDEEDSYRSIHRGEVGFARILELDSDDDNEAHEYVTSESEDEDEAHADLLRYIAELEAMAQRGPQEESELHMARLRARARENAEADHEERYRH